HNLSVVEHVADDIMVMYLGRVVEHGDSETVFAKPLHPYTQALLSAAPSLKEQKVQLKLAGELPSPLNPPSGCALHQRCPHARERCAQEVPELREWRGRKVACLRLEEIAA
ncbi:oligopeptide/dipeptide ABC transporter ATP-binding protein, partial [Neisseria sp.]|uniref:oligopeptide/dipeptide ABC transporter ATP-binding protein n=1 Tax=Neisseria sp. TaxID=192066 RepID=UPI002700B022|nr:dipeptide ABC transporter ATP-binding protein [Neisseria sp.]